MTSSIALFFTPCSWTVLSTILHEWPLDWYPVKYRVSLSKCATFQSIQSTTFSLLFISFLLLSSVGHYINLTFDLHTSHVQDTHHFPGRYRQNNTGHSPNLWSAVSMAGSFELAVRNRAQLGFQTWLVQAGLWQNWGVTGLPPPSTWKVQPHCSASQPGP